jgi:hypothetical protein
MSKTKSVNTFDLMSLEKAFMQFVADIAGSQRQIDLDLIASLKIRSDFLECVRIEREKLFVKLVKDPEADHKEYLTYNFGFLEDLVSNEFNAEVVPEDTKTPLNAPTKSIMSRFNLPTHFYLWTFTWLDKGIEPKHLPAIIDLDILVRSKEYLKTNSGLPTDTKKNLKRLFSEYVNSIGKSKNQKTTKVLKEIVSLLSKIPKNIYRQKPILKKTIELNKNKSSSYSDIAFSSHYEKVGDFLAEDEVKIRRVADKLRKRKSHYLGKVKKH